MIDMGLKEFLGSKPDQEKWIAEQTAKGYLIEYGEKDGEYWAKIGGRLSSPCNGRLGKLKCQLDTGHKGLHRSVQVLYGGAFVHIIEW